MFYLDAKVQGEPTPPGFAAFGPQNPNTTNQTLNNQIKRISAYFAPDDRQWPQTEFCIDSGALNPVDEHLPDLNGWIAWHWASLAL